MLNLRNRTDKLRYQRLVDRMMASLERIYSKKINIVLNKQFQKASSLVLAGNEKKIDSAVDSQRTVLKKIIEIHYKRTASMFGTFAFDNLSKKKSYYPPYQKDGLEAFWAAMNVWSKKRLLRNITETTQTTKTILKRIIKHGLDEGLSPGEIAKKINQARKLFNPNRALMIARTETHSGAVNSMNVAVETTDIDFSREWIAMLDDRTRGSGENDEFNHIKANGEKVGMKEPFTDTGEELDYPGDPDKGSAGNIINCRCVVVYV